LFNPFVFSTFIAFTKQLATEHQWDAIVIGSGMGGNFRTNVLKGPQVISCIF
jgi:folylpolyglutamate synthase/dihydropteroate synthase